MDGNGRWAQQRGLTRTEGHKAGEHSLFDVLEGADEIGVGWFTVYAFSTENWRRPKDEVRFLLNFNEQILLERRDELNERNVRIRFAGRRDWRVPADKVTEKLIARNLYDPGMPDPDLMIRTSGEYRISNFLLWELAYSELVFSEVLWPDFRREHLYAAIKEYQDRDRRYGGVG